MIDAAKRWARGLKAEVRALAIAARDRRTPWYAKALALAVVAYAVSPIDLIPDAIPVLGYLDDLVIVPLGILLTVRLIPAPLMAEFRRMASESDALPSGRFGAALVVAAWLAVSAAGVWWLAGVLRG
ncbi:hypothetical protein DLJ53_26035 [Acuticoccus sediminis]|uniref:DUF1232 domain-containing protein n=1 Tax=Acuticoccus sediminis TaxID=2184697 RepID=A0A8B2NG00_9HYPH|nr:DUF1232 domain-containing protein [Acuticoccus sediminis]RAH98180.1 hypothetical protein DLJ53_26035 [Acuticoccus sediminis]